MGEQPLFQEFKPFSKAQLADPYTVLARARDQAPVFYAPEFDFWVVTRYEDVNRIYGEPALYSSSSVLSPRMERPAEIDREFGDRQLGLHHQLVMSDPPAHTRLKKLMSPAFLPRRILAREEWIRELTHKLIDAFEANGEADLVRSYAARIPTAVIGKIIGAPEDDARNFAHWVDDIFTLTGAWDIPEAERARAWRGVFAFEDYIRSLIAERRCEPQDDLTTDFIQARSDDGSPAMNDTEVLWNVFNIAGAGADTTGVLIAQLIHLLLTHPDQWEAVRRDKSLITNAVDETMRVRSPVRGLMRKTTAEVSIAGITIPAGAFVFIHLASANHDSQIFTDPRQFDIRRPNANRHLGFGSRSHACIGAPLARLEARIALETLIDRLPGLELLEDSKIIQYKPNLMLPAVAFLKARW
ncbi:cytochrome P450 [uncultured Sphingosinicella sp.]|uniref:cytochrome P450 n=1 Tax=uncultured Sphingosinicella sp. TaxID=478748 RepID=UPI0030DD3A45